MYIYIYTLSTQEARNLILEMAATCSHSSGRKWPQVAVSILLSPAATCRLEWPQVAASGRQHSLVTGSHLQPLAATCSHLQPLEWPQVAASGRQHSLVTGSHLQPLEWPQVAASGRQHSLVTGSHLHPLAATRVAASGRKWLPDILPRKLFHIFRGWPTETLPHFPQLTHGNFSTFSAANPHSERQGKTHNENARVPTKRKEKQLRGKTYWRSGQRCNEKKRLRTTGKDPQRKRPSLNEQEGEVILRGRTYWKKRTTLQRKKETWNDRERPTTKTHEFKRKGRRSN